MSMLLVLFLIIGCTSVSTISNLKELPIKLIAEKDVKTGKTLYRSLKPHRLDFLMSIKDQLPCKNASYFRSPFNSNADTWVIFCEKVSVL